MCTGHGSRILNDQFLNLEENLQREWHRQGAYFQTKNYGLRIYYDLDLFLMLFIF